MLRRRTNYDATYVRLLSLSSLCGRSAGRELNRTKIGTKQWKEEEIKGHLKQKVFVRLFLSLSRDIVGGVSTLKSLFCQRVFIHSWFAKIFVYTVERKKQTLLGQGFLRFGMSQRFTDDRLHVYSRRSIIGFFFSLNI